MLKSTPPSERPRERCLQNGARCLSLRELVALLLGSGPRDIGSLGLALEVLERAGPGMNGVEQERAFFAALELSAPSALAGVRGLGDAGQARLLAAFEIGRRYHVLRSTDVAERKSGSRTLADSRLEALEKISRAWRCEPAEWLGFIPLYRSGQLGELNVVERGLRTHVNTDPAELFSRVLALRPRAFFLFHNHPSGNLSPSPSDHDLTQKVDAVARQLGLRLLAHGIVTAASEHWIDGESG